MDMREVVSDAVGYLRVQANSSTLWTRWFWWILGGSLSLLLITFLVLEGLNKSEKAAKALHQVDVLREKQAHAKVDAVIAKSEKKRQVLILKADKHIASADKQLKKNVKLQVRVKKNQAIIDNLRDWDDVEKNIKW